jgi:hypothetical protein
MGERTEMQAAERDRLAVDRLRRIAEMTAERDRLARILAVERGDESAAPEGWRFDAGSVHEGTLDGWRRDASGSTVDVVRERAGSWSPPPWIDGRYPTALEAMDAADAARGGDND